MVQLAGRRSATAFCAMANALTAGSVFTYPIFSPALRSVLNFSAKQVAATASIAILCQYICAAFWGSLADRRGPALVSLLAGVSFFLGYTALALLLSSSEEPEGPAGSFRTWFGVTLAYSVCGSATGASYFAAITGSTRVFGISYPSLSIAGPASFFGLSPLLFTFLGTRFFEHRNHFDVSGYLYMLAIVPFIANFCGWIGLPSSPVSSAVQHDPERAPLISSSPQPHHTPDSATQSGSTDNSQVTTLKGFLTEPTVWYLGFTVLLTAGPTEMTIASIGAVADSFQSSVPVSLKAQHVQLISIANTFSRLGSGWASDRLCCEESGAGIRRLGFMALAPAVYAVVCAWIMVGGKELWILSLTTGLCYGTFFTLAPSIVAKIWPIRDFGRNYGIITYFAAIGSFVFTFLFGIFFDQNSSIAQHRGINLIYGISGLSELAAVGFTFALYRYQYKLEH